MTFLRKLLASVTSVRLTDTSTSDIFKLSRTRSSARIVTSASAGVRTKARTSQGAFLTMTGKWRLRVLEEWVSGFSRFELMVIKIRIATTTEANFQTKLYRTYSRAAKVTSLHVDTRSALR